MSTPLVVDVNLSRIPIKDKGLKSLFFALPLSYLPVKTIGDLHQLFKLQRGESNSYHVPLMDVNLSDILPKETRGEKSSLRALPLSYVARIHIRIRTSSSGFQCPACSHTPMNASLGFTSRD